MGHGMRATLAILAATFCTLLAVGAGRAVAEASRLPGIVTALKSRIPFFAGNRPDDQGLVELFGRPDDPKTFRSNTIRFSYGREFIYQQRWPGIKLLRITGDHIEVDFAPPYSFRAEDVLSEEMIRAEDVKVRVGTGEKEFQAESKSWDSEIVTPKTGSRYVRSSLTLTFEKTVYDSGPHLANPAYKVYIDLAAPMSAVSPRRWNEKTMEYEGPTIYIDGWRKFRLMRYSELSQNH